MTKPCNFPERKNARRKAALLRTGRKENKAAAEAEADALATKIKPSLRHVQTKKRGPKEVRIGAFRRKSA